MTTIIPFVPSSVQAPQFNLTLDSNEYIGTVEWVLFAQRYYLKIEGLRGDLILYTALIGSPIGLDISALSWANGKVTVTTTDPHHFRFGQILNVTIADATPAAYNGTYQALVTGRNTLTFPLATNPGIATVFGNLQQNINLAGGLFQSTLIFREDNSQFEVSP
jgi:hypothetical protein